MLPSDKVSFGFKDVALTEKTAKVREVFDRVASRYDLMNDLMSLGIHRAWKNALIQEMAPKAGMHLLDVAGGTGDVAARFLKAAPETRVTICDINFKMMAAGRKRLQSDRLGWVCGNAECLPFPDNSVDLYSISFGLRNVTRTQEALCEAHRVLKPGGRFFCLEFSRVHLPVLDRLYKAYSFKVIPLIGRVVAQDAAAYQYLVESIARFPSQEKFTHMLKEAGFQTVRYQNYFAGVAALHTGWKI